MSKTACCKSKQINNKPAEKVNSISSFMTTLLIILLPKCPLCIGAYAGAALLFFDVEGSQLAPYFKHLRPLLGAVILILILMNNKGKKTVFAGLMTLLALSLLLVSTYLDVDVVPLWTLYLVFVLAIWFNGNFEYFFKYLKAKLTYVFGLGPS